MKQPLTLTEKIYLLDRKFLRKMFAKRRDELWGIFMRHEMTGEEYSAAMQKLEGAVDAAKRKQDEEDDFRP